jgi:uncharacterized protein involved in outer membrane biogenesis
VRVNCAAANLDLVNGVARPQIFAFDTENAVINVTGTASMASEQLDLTIDPESKGIRIITLRSPLYVRGTFKNPQAGVKPGPLIARGAVAAALATLVTPRRSAAGVDFAVRRRGESVPDHFVADEEVRCGLFLPGGAALTRPTFES